MSVVVSSRRIWFAVLIGFSFAIGILPLRAADSGLGDVRFLRIIPRTSQEIAQAHDKARGSACEPVPPEEPLEITNYTPYLSDRDRQDAARGMLLMPSTRRHILTVGLEVSEADKRRLPKVSGGQILRYLQSHFVTIQARVQKEPVTGELFLHHRPMAATTKFTKGGLTEDFTEPTLLAIQDFHSLGILLPFSEKPTPKNCRTLVMTYRNMTAVSNETVIKTVVRPAYEFLFIRGREAKSPGSPQLTLHSFCTTEERRKLHWFEPWVHPQVPRDCTIFASVVFTNYTTLGLIPSKSATRDIRYDTKATFDVVRLDDYVQEQGWRGDTFENLPAVLDAILDGKITADSR